MSTQNTSIKINGMSCGHCVQSVTRALQATEGVDVRHVEIGRADISYDPTRVTPGAIAQVIDDIGFEMVEEVKSEK